MSKVLKSQATEPSKVPTTFKAMAADPNTDVKKTDLYRANPLLVEEEEDFNLRDYSDPDVIAQIEAFCKSYQKGAYVPPWIVRTTSDGRIVVVEGHLRRRGARLAIERGIEIPYVDILPFRGNNAEQIEVMLRSEQGLKLKPLDIAIGYLRLHRLGHTNVMIASAVNVTSARVEQMLLVAQANADVHQMIRSGVVAFDAAIEAVRNHRELAGDFLAGKLEEARDNGKAKVTRGVMRGPTVPPKVVSKVVSSVQSVVSAIDAKARVQLAQYETMDPEQLRGKTVAVDAAALLALFRAHSEVVDATKKQDEARATQAFQMHIDAFEK